MIVDGSAYIEMDWDRERAIYFKKLSRALLSANDYDDDKLKVRREGGWREHVRKGACLERMGGGGETYFHKCP